ncbi:biopolymer transporter ExbD [Polynucleobacter sp. SHI8]|uniref:ExbD/TolR family protein n=1 Tax=unclassified Polynucleobacter TaxID=2640945 RepID=UPI00249339CB|nr:MULTISPECIES: biopolymer transporter ExbD [unclassified Polynucleobacter]BDW11328.1 biopolymer transporter ExbD [Polynucleobacter sp. SHI2]BDW13775.1 biopolymer transporter ExbD [Polynucleobacter sp. SHI8]
MAFSSPQGDDDTGLMAEINMTPFVDVMLVLLIIFIVTLPVIQHSVKIELPKAASSASNSKPETIQVSIDANGKIFWNTTPVTLDEYIVKAKQAAAQEPIPEVNLRADRRVKYDSVAQVLSASKRNGLTKLGFVTETP